VSKKNASLKKRYLRLVRSVDALLRQHDPMDLLNAGAPSDEYEPEAHAIAGRLTKCADVESCRLAVADVFDQQFGASDRSPEQYLDLARELFALKEQNPADEG
jgi:hypothetical protein